MSDRHDAIDAFARRLVELATGNRAPAKLTGVTTDGGTDETRGFPNPMTAAGALIVGGESGAADELAVGTEGQVLTVVSGAPAWADPTGGGGPATGQYRHFVLTEDGSGGWGFVTATVDGQTWPVFGLFDLE